MKAGRAGGQNKKIDNVVRMPGATADVLPPSSLSDHERRIWDALAPSVIQRGHLTVENADVFAGYCRCVWRVRQAEAVLDRDGILIPGRDGNLVKNPAVTIAKTYRDHCIKYETLFGLTPLALASMPKVEKPKVRAWDKKATTEKSA